MNFFYNILCFLFFIELGFILLKIQYAQIMHIFSKYLYKIMCKKFIRIFIKNMYKYIFFYKNDLWLILIFSFLILLHFHINSYLYLYIFHIFAATFPLRANYPELEYWDTPKYKTNCGWRAESKKKKCLGSKCETWQRQLQLWKFSSITHTPCVTDRNTYVHI